jgi:glycosyltransferase involved in cell wall biosynthesis
MSRLNILLVPAWYPSDGSSAGVFVREQAHAAALYDDVAVYADAGPHDEPRRRSALRVGDEDGIETIRITRRASSLPGADAAAYTRGLVRTIAHLRRRGQGPRALHAHVYYAGVAALFAGRLFGIPVIVSEHSSAFSLGTLSGTERLRARLVFGHADLVCPVSAYLRDRIEGLGVSTRFEVVPNPVDTRVFTQKREGGTTAPPHRILVVAGLQPVKGVDTLLAAVADLHARREDFQVDILGDGDAEGVYERTAARLGLAGLVRFHGARSKAEVARFMRESSFLVMPSVTETFGVVAAEAFASGIPVVGMRVGAIPELVDERTGFLVDPPDAPSLAKAIDTMLDRHAEFDPGRLARLASERFGRDAVGQRWHEVYRRVAARRRTSPAAPPGP